MLKSDAFDSHVWKTQPGLDPTIGLSALKLPTQQAELLDANEAAMLPAAVAPQPLEAEPTPEHHPLRRDALTIPRFARRCKNMHAQSPIVVIVTSLLAKRH